MLFLAGVLLIVTGQSGPRVTEFYDGTVVIEDGDAKTTIKVNSRLQGKLGWSFDLTESGKLVTVEPTELRKSGHHARVVLRDGVHGTPRTLASDTAGFSSPLFSPDGSQIVLVRGSGELVVIDVTSGAVTRVGEGVAGFWDTRNTLYAYQRSGDGCHQVTRIGDGSVVDRLCVGDTALSIINGAPGLLALPVVDTAGLVVGWLGARSDSTLSLDADQLGYACSEGVDYHSKDGKWVTLESHGDSLSVKIGRSCGRAETGKSAIKGLKIRATK